jgi:TorA maturation chaperone TorD
MKRILMLSSQPLFSRGVEHLLSRQANLEIVGRESNYDRAIEQIRRLKPEAVILDTKDLASTPAGLVALILKEAPDATVISLNLENDRICVYRGEQRSAQCIDDLLEVLDEDLARPKPILAQEWLSLAIDRAQVYALLAASYNRPVDDTLLDHLGASSFRLIGSLSQDNDLTGDLGEGLQALERFRLDVIERPRPALLADLGREYNQLLLGGQPEAGGVATWPCETAHAGAEAWRGPSIREAVSQAYRTGGFCPPVRGHTPPDFVGCELEFMRHLCALEQAAWSGDERGAALAAQSHERAFLKDHLIRWLPRCCDALLAHAQLDFYRGILYLSKGFILNEAYRVAELMEAADPVEPKLAHA